MRVSVVPATNGCINPRWFDHRTTGQVSRSGGRVVMHAAADTIVLTRSKTEVFAGRVTAGGRIVDIARGRILIVPSADRSIDTAGLRNADTRFVTSPGDRIEIFSGRNGKVTAGFKRRARRIPIGSIKRSLGNRRAGG